MTDITGLPDGMFRWRDVLVIAPGKIEDGTLLRIHSSPVGYLPLGFGRGRSPIGYVPLYRKYEPETEPPKEDPVPTPTTLFDATTHLNSTEDILAYLQEALESKDDAEVREAVHTAAQAWRRLDGPANEVVHPVAPILGYPRLKDSQVETVNFVKCLEGWLMRGHLLQPDKNDSPNVGRWKAIARTHLETGFMYLVKSICKPMYPPPVLAEVDDALDHAYELAFSPPGSPDPDEPEQPQSTLTKELIDQAVSEAKAQQDRLNQRAYRAYKENLREPLTREDLGEWEIDVAIKMYAAKISNSSFQMGDLDYQRYDVHLGGMIVNTNIPAGFIPFELRGNILLGWAPSIQRSKTKEDENEG